MDEGEEEEVEDQEEEEEEEIRAEEGMRTAGQSQTFVHISSTHYRIKYRYL